MQPQDALQATEALRGDPLLYVLVSVLIVAVVALSGFVMFLLKRNHALQDANTTLAKAGTEAIAAFTPLMQGMDARVLEAFKRIESAFKDGMREMKDHVNLLKKIE